MVNHLGGRENFEYCSPVVSLGGAEDAAQELSSGALAAASFGAVLFTSVTVHTAGPLHV